MMEEAERRALAALRFNWAPTPDDVWQHAPFHVEGLHRTILDLVLDGVADADKDTNQSPIGIALQGSRGTGKTHLLGTVRERVQQQGGYFFLVELLEASAFWRSTAMSMLDGFARPRPDGESQLTFFIQELAHLVDAPRPVRLAVTGRRELTRPDLDAFADLIRKHNRQVGIECQDTARALVLQAATSLRAQDVGYEFLCSNDEVDPGDRAAWGMRRGKRSAQEIVRDISRLLAMTGPTVIAVDQIDLLIAQSVKSSSANDRRDWQTSLLLEQIAGGLMELRQSTRRSLSVVACLPQTWAEIKRQATDTVQDRFHEAVWLKEIPSAELGLELIERRFGLKFRDIGFVPPYPTWPVRPEAFEEAVQFTPREMLRTVDRHVRTILATGELQELTHLLTAAHEATTEAGVRDNSAHPSLALSKALHDIDIRFAALCESAIPAPALTQDAEDGTVPGLLRAGLTAWIGECDQGSEAFSIDPQAGGKPALHARLRRAIDDVHEDEEHWSFRAICAPHHIAALNRIRNAITTAGLTEGVSKRRLFLLRSRPWSDGTRTQEVISAFKAAGGLTLPFTESDVRRLSALRDLISGYGEESLRPWFVTRQPTAQIEFLRTALADAARNGQQATPEPSTAAGHHAALPVTYSMPISETGDALPLGTVIGTEESLSIDLEALRRHTAIFAGSGSGKTVLIRRLIEECALRGVSAIVLDPNNDLARLGEPWPEPPEVWGPDDAARAVDYLENTDVTVWTPRRQSGRPLSFQPLPEFAEILDDPDAFIVGIDAAVAALAPHAHVDGSTDKARLSKAVLREALTSYARTGANDLRGFISLLNDLPDSVSELEDAVKLGRRMAQLLTAAMVNDPLFGGDGAPVDPGVLLNPPPGKRARVSVISFVGLPDDKQRQTFVNQLQLALFAWIKRHPAGDRPLGGLFVMDEAQTLAPSGAMTACTQSTLVLASQARKYGLGLVFATQAPKGLHNQIPGNAATQFFGLLTSMTQIDAAQQIARAKGSSIEDVGRLGRGQFYAAVEGATFRKVQAPLCLTHHPKSPLTTEEVMRRARPDGG